MDLKDSLEGELLAIVQELGTFSGDNGTIQHGDRTIDSARKILQCLSKDDPKERPLHFQLGCWKVVQNYFIPLLNEYYEDDALAMLIRMKSNYPTNRLSSSLIVFFFFEWKSSKPCEDNITAAKTGIKFGRSHISSSAL